MHTTYVAPESLIAFDPRYLRPDEHTELIGHAGKALLDLTLSDDFQNAFGGREAPFTMRMTYPDQQDPTSDIIRKTSKVFNEYCFVEKEGDLLGGKYDKYKKVEVVLFDNRFGRPAPVAAITPQIPTPDPEKPGELLMPLGLLAAEGDPWQQKLKWIARMTKDSRRKPIPDISSREVLERTWDISLVNALPSHRFLGRYAGRFNIVEWMYNVTLRAAEGACIDRMDAALDERVLRGLQRYGKFWHPLVDMPFLPYDTKVEGSNKSTVATVDLKEWKSFYLELLKYDDSPARNHPADILHRLWGNALELAGVEIIGLRE